MVARLVECSDYDEMYGILTVKNISAKEVQDKIYDIKNKFCDEGNYSWCVDDVLEKFPDEWDWDFERVVDILEI